MTTDGVAAGPRRALVTGITGQDGTYLAEQLLAEGVEVHGIVRSMTHIGNIEHLRDRLTLTEGDLLEPGVLARVIGHSRPDELYHLAAPTFVPDSWVRPRETFDAIAGVTATLLVEAHALSPLTRVFVASSREIFGATDDCPQSESSSCRPRSPYGIAKLAGHQLVGVLRTQLGLHASSAVLFNHESPLRPERFVTRKVTRAAAAAKLGLDVDLNLGDLEAVRDWSAASDFMRGARMIVRAAEPDDYVLASGVGRTVRELVDTAFDYVSLDPARYLRVDDRHVRPTEAVAAIGDATRARDRLGWKPEVDFSALIAEMVEADLRRLNA
jgi:GDPmannose 4,6-dehydratase